MTTAVLTSRITNRKVNFMLPIGLKFKPKDTNYKLLTGAWKQSSTKPDYPVDKTTAFELLRLMGYTVSTLHMLEIAQGGDFTPPEIGWDADDIVALADQLEARRCWMPQHICHVHKYTAEEKKVAERLHEQAKKKVAILQGLEDGQLVRFLSRDDIDPTERHIAAAIMLTRLGLLPRPE